MKLELTEDEKKFAISLVEKEQARIASTTRALKEYGCYDGIIKDEIQYRRKMLGLIENQMIKALEKAERQQRGQHEN